VVKFQEAMPKLSITAPAKIIFTGEHSVVYGHPALASTINRFIRLSIFYDEKKINSTFFRSILDDFSHNDATTIINIINDQELGCSRINIDTNITIGSGMGSSAALAVALSYLVLFLAYKKKPTSLKINEKAFLIEKKFHSNPSGADNTVITYGGSMVFQKNSDNLSFEKIKMKLDKNWWLIFTGRPVETTRDMVALVKDSYQNERVATETILNEIGKTSLAIIELFKGKNFKRELLLNYFKINSQLLSKLGVVSSSVINLIEEIQENGGVAKISGAGGRLKGSGTMLVYHEDQEYLFHFCKLHKLELFPLELTNSGVNAKIDF
jgi:mevalonate kinase